MSPRVLRQILIAFIFILALGLAFYWYKSSQKVVPTCVDGIQNGLEEGIDCGISACGVACQPQVTPLEVKSTEILNTGSGLYDFAAEVFNPNRQYGSAESSYVVTLLDKDSKELAKKEGTFYILPGEDKYIIVSAIPSTARAVTAQFKITSAQWERLDSLDGIDFSIKNKTYTVLSGGFSSDLKALLVNNSDYDYGQVDIRIILFDDANKILAVNKTDVRTILAHGERAFEVNWPFKISGKVANIDVEATTNLYDNLNYIKRYGSPTEKFQQYY